LLLCRCRDLGARLAEPGEFTDVPISMTRSTWCRRRQSPT
jgi:tRNA U34 5-carboxymethylaminomethyl modifying GTPase MnmE/TrmE